MIPRDVVETVALVALFVISGGLCVLLGYALGRMRGEEPPERPADLEPAVYRLTPEEGARLEELLETTGPADRLRELLRPPTVSPAPEPVTVSSPDVTVVSNSGGATAVSGAAVAVVDARGRR